MKIKDVMQSAKANEIQKATAYFDDKAGKYLLKVTICKTIDGELQQETGFLTSAEGKVVKFSTVEFLNSFLTKNNIDAGPYIITL